MQWDFPGRACQLPFSDFQDASFQNNLVTHLELASIDSLERFEAHAAKATVSVSEARDTTDPGVISQWLMSIIEATGSSIQTPILRKRVRDDVNINKSKLPWRRLPFWLLLRVTTQRQLCLMLGNEVGRGYYKLLIATMLQEFLDDCSGKLSSDLVTILAKKLSRRGAKLEIEKAHVDALNPFYDYLLRMVVPSIQESIQNAMKGAKLAWNHYTRVNTRKIPKLPLRAKDSDLRLSLRNCGPYLDSLLKPVRQTNVRGLPATSLEVPSLGDGTTKQVAGFATVYYEISEIEEVIATECRSSSSSSENHLIQLANLMQKYVDKVDVHYDGSPEQISLYILNRFDLWVQLDRYALKLCPLLREFHPRFEPELLDVLQLPLLSDMQRLLKIQSYLKARCHDCSTYESIFSDSKMEGSFASCYVSSDAKMLNLKAAIEIASASSRVATQSKWTQFSNKYDNHSQEIAGNSCRCTRNPDGTKSVKGCNKCYHWRQRRKLEIKIHEDFLPERDRQKNVVVFELLLPKYLSMYRNATWSLVTLAHPSKKPASLELAMLLKDCTQLKKWNASSACGITLGSSSKAFQKTHYKNCKTKVDLELVLLPCGLDLSYYDEKSNVWLSDVDKPLTFQHLCGIHIPTGLKGTIIKSKAHPPPVMESPSSYDIVASQTRCPPGMSVHESMSYQKLMIGTNQRWVNLLTELGSSNLNFSSEETMLIYSQLAVQAGSAGTSEILRDAHIVFQDEQFCLRLAELIRSRLADLQSNWRETQCMELLITLSLRLFTLSSGAGRRAAEELIKKARATTLAWISILQREVQNSVDSDAVERAAMYGFWASLLCRRTFSILIGTSSINNNDLTCFVQASIALQENLVIDLSKLSRNTKFILVHDLKLAYQLRPIVSASILSRPLALGNGINSHWCDADNALGRSYSAWKLLPASKNWIVSNFTTENSTQPQLLHFNIVEGHLLVDGKPLGRLPIEIRRSTHVRELFGTQHLLTSPSTLFGMSHCLQSSIHDQRIHFGMRGQEVIIRSQTQQNVIREYVPRTKFASSSTYDLPVALIEGCVHWLNLTTKRLEIRRKPVLWFTRVNDWVVDIPSRLGKRNKVFLVNPQSRLCEDIAKIFGRFEKIQNMTVYQPEDSKGRLSVEMKHLGLSFSVSVLGRLHSRDLRAEIASNQDAGTLYGFESKIVLRDPITERRSIIVALGKLEYTRHGSHVLIRSGLENGYATYEIDDTLGRLTCPPDPQLLYYKALLHAVTSFILPDRLTGRTGTEEAIHLLSSELCQPCTPLQQNAISILRSIQSLCPSREYYPKDKKRLQSVSWNPDLTTTIQHDSYDFLVQSILYESERLRAFDLDGTSTGEVVAPTFSHLRSRGEAQRTVYGRQALDSEASRVVGNYIYSSRDRDSRSAHAMRVCHTVRLVIGDPFEVDMEEDLSIILQDWKLIGGFSLGQSNSAVSLYDLIEKDISEQWGDLVLFCQEADRWQLIFRLSLLSFCGKAKRNLMSLITSFVAFNRLPELSSLPTPAHATFQAFQPHESPTEESLPALISKGYPMFDPDPELDEDENDEAESEHRTNCSDDGTELARSLLYQWPNQIPSAEGTHLFALDADTVMELINPEWERLIQNLDLSRFLDYVESILDSNVGDMEITTFAQVCNQTVELFATPSRGSIIPTLVGECMKRNVSPQVGSMAYSYGMFELQAISSPRP